MNYLYTEITENGKTVTEYELSDYFSLILIGIFAVLFLIIIIKLVLHSLKTRKKELEELEKCEDIPLVEIDARVLKKECFVKSYGTKMPESRKEFFITFLTFNGETRHYSVSEEIYLSIEEGVSGTIGLLNDNFFDFYYKGEVL